MLTASHGGAFRGQMAAAALRAATATALFFGFVGSACHTREACFEDDEVSLLQSWTKMTVMRRPDTPSVVEFPTDAQQQLPAAREALPVVRLPTTSDLRKENRTANYQVSDTWETLSMQAIPFKREAEHPNKWSSGPMPEFNITGEEVAHLADDIGLEFNPEDQSASRIVGAKKNGLHDMAGLLGSIGLYGVLLIGAIVLFHYLRYVYPLVYAYNTLPHESRTEEDAKMELLNPIPEEWWPNPANWLDWVKASIALQFRLEELTQYIGLDMVLLLYFMQFAMEVLLWVGLPLAFLLSAVNAFFGKVGVNVKCDLLSKIGLNNMENGSNYFWVHAVFMWYVVWCVQDIMSKYQGGFMRKRLRWLAGMQAPRCTTVMLQNIPEEYRQLPSAENNALPEQHLKNMIEEQVFGVMKKKLRENVVKDVVFVRPALQLKEYEAQLESLRTLLADMNAEIEERMHAETEEPSLPKDSKETDGEKSVRRVDGKTRGEETELMAKEALANLDYRKTQAQDDIRLLENLISGERQRVIEREVSSTAFVTFTERIYADFFLNIRLTSSEMQFISSTPPDPVEVNWANVLHDPTIVRWKLVGYALILGLFVAYVPFVGFISAMTELSYVKKLIPALKHIMSASPWLANLWNALFASLGLTIFMAFLPSCFMWILRRFFPSVGASEGQLGLQKWYFAFQLIFVVLVTAISGSIVALAHKVVHNPLAFFSMLAVQLPNRTHFYLNWFVLQWFTSVLGLLRYVNIFKYLSLRAGFALFMPEERKDRRAKALSEPENTDCYGIGARSADGVLFLSIGLIYCNLLPIICIFALVSFAVSRIFLGYQIVFAETRKPDSGGTFWCEQMQQVQAIMFIYVMLMIFVFLYRTNSLPLQLFTLALLPYQIWRYCIFTQKFNVDLLPFLQLSQTQQELKAEGVIGKQIAATGSYVQPELR